MRNLHADLALCEAATPGPWRMHNAGLDRGHTYASFDGVLGLIAEDSRIEDAEFIAQAREGWPEAIRRAIEAEAEVERLSAFIESESEVAIDTMLEIERLKAENARYCAASN